MDDQRLKADAGKLRWALLPYDAVSRVVHILNFGAEKYAPRGWEQGMDYSRLFSAAQRHLTAWFQEGEDRDPESGQHHLAHAACCVLFLLTYEIRGIGNDDRPEV